MKLSNKLESEHNILYIFETDDGYKIESVLAKSAECLCVSTHVGCNIGCTFCASCKKGYYRDLNESEILFQAEHVYNERKFLQDLHIGGIGEPLNNFDNVLSTIEKVKDRIHSFSISTSVPSIEKLDRALNFDFSRITISLHGITEEVRKKLIPNSIQLEKILEYLREKLQQIPGLKDKIYLGYLLLEGVNDSKADIDQLISVVQKLNVSIFLMYCNKISDDSILHTDDNRFSEVMTLLKEKNINFSKSSPSRKDKIGGCGTLRINRSNIED
jgi:23S rRNA (adenine2503-C2)-methyltransferase